MLACRAEFHQRGVLILVAGGGSVAPRSSAGQGHAAGVVQPGRSAERGIPGFDAHFTRLCRDRLAPRWAVPGVMVTRRPATARARNDSVSFLPGVGRARSAL